MRLLRAVRFFRDVRQRLFTTARGRLVTRSVGYQSEVESPWQAAAMLGSAAAATLLGGGVVLSQSSPDYVARGRLAQFYQISEPHVVSEKSPEGLWQDYGVNVVLAKQVARGPLWHFKPQTTYRPFNEEDEKRLRDMKGQFVSAARNPGVRFEANFIEPEEEEALAREVLEVARAHGSIMSNAREYAASNVEGGDSEAQLVLLPDGRIIPDPSGTRGPTNRVTGRPEGGNRQRAVPWGYGVNFKPEALTPRLAKVVRQIQNLEGFSLGPLRDVTINVRTSSVCRMDPHIDPLSDGANCFILTLLSGAVITFSPLDALEREVDRATDPRTYGMRSFTDEDVDGILRRRSICHFAGDARYNFTHAIRPGLPVELQDASGKPHACICDWWGTHAELLPRKNERISIVFAFADPFRAAEDETIEQAKATGLHQLWRKVFR